jgi:hypothetical protein
MMHITLRDHWYDINFLNVHAPNEDKSDNMNDRICEELEHVFDQFPKYNMKILLDFNAKVGRENIFKLTIRENSLHEISNDNRVRVANFAT